MTDMKNQEKKEDQLKSPSFGDADYQQDMRVDRLTTLDAVRRELEEIKENIESRSDEQEDALVEQEPVEDKGGTTEDEPSD